MAVAELVGEILHDKVGDIDPREVHEFEGTHRVVQAELDGGIDIFNRGDPFLQQADALPETGESRSG